MLVRHAMRLRTIAESRHLSTASELGSRHRWNGRNWRPDAQVQALGGIAPGARHLEHLEGVDESQVLALRGIAIGTSQGQAQATDVDGGAGQGHHGGRTDVRNEIPESIHGHHHAGHTAVGARRRGGQPLWSMASTSSPRSAGSQRPDAMAAASGAKISRPWNVALTSLTPNCTRRVLSMRITRSICPRAASGASKPLSGASNACSFDSATSRCARSSNAGVDHRHVRGAGRKIAQSSGQPEAGFHRLKGADVVRHVDELELRRMRQHHAFHDADEGLAQTEVGG